MIPKKFIALSILAISSLKVHAEEPDLLKMTCTSYQVGEITASGTKPTAYYTIASKREYLGKYCVIYERNDDNTIGQYISEGMIEDTGEGKNGAIRKGYVIDIYTKGEEPIPTQKVWVQVIDGKG